MFNGDECGIFDVECALKVRTSGITGGRIKSDAKYRREHNPLF